MPLFLFSSFFFLPPLFLHVLISHPLFVFHYHCWCELNARLCPHSTRLCGSYYRQVFLKDRRTFPLWFRYSKLHECLGFSWAWNSCIHLHLQLWRCSLQVKTLPVCYWIWSTEGHALFGKMLHSPKKYCTVWTSTGLLWPCVRCYCHACFTAAWHTCQNNSSDPCFNSVCFLRVCVFTVIFKVVTCLF